MYCKLLHILRFKSPLSLPCKLGSKLTAVLMDINFPFTSQSKGLTVTQ